MSTAKYGTGTLRKRGDIWHVVYWVDGKQRQKSSKSSDIREARKLRDKLLGQKARGELTSSQMDNVTCGELLDDLLEHAAANIKPSTEKIWRLVIEANIRPFFGKIRVTRLTTEKFKEYRAARKSAKRSDATANRELSILRTALHLGRKCTPPKVNQVPHFPMVAETNTRQGFLTDEQYVKLRDALPDYLKPLFVVAYFTGVRRGELLSIRWSQVDLEKRVIVLRPDETKSGDARAVPILDGDMREQLEMSRRNWDQDLGDAPVFSNAGVAIKDFRGAWESSCKAAGLPSLRFHDLRRSAVVRMRRAGVPQVVRMKITGHKTDSMDRRYGIVDTEDIELARRLMEGLGK
jgi:integrase